MSLILATQLTAIATLALAVLALATAVFAAGAFWTQYQQLKGQVGELNREAGERRRAQAVRIYIRDEPAQQRFPQGEPTYWEIPVHVSNTSEQPIYDLHIMMLQAGEATGINQGWGTLMPRAQADPTIRIPHETDSSSLTASARFRDRDGQWWRIHTDGRLEEWPLRPELPVPR